MKRNAVLTVLALVVLSAGAIIVWRAKGRAPAQPDPSFHHTPAGVNAALQEQRTVLTEALSQKDLPLIHGQMYYVEGLVDALAGKLEGEQKQRVEPALAETKRIAEEIDNFSGRGNFEATDAGLKKLFEVFDTLDAEFKPARK